MVRFKHRYLLVSLVFPDSLLTPANPHEPFTPPQMTESSLISLLRDSLAVNFGDVGAGEVGGTFSIKYFSPSTSTLILRVSREHHRTLWAALTLLRKVGGQECVARVVHVSGTIRKTQHAAMAHDRAAILLSASRTRARARARARARQGRAGAAMGAMGAKAGEDRDEAGVDAETERRLRESEERIAAMEA
ncbi:ribonucleases P/MRP protein subunit POP5 [Rhodotorula diobovata]|uniref:Ribonucleases P/MRP protein subunit POP5 n=1 Tax=Rhodotorula diobovata TaxID=5288 RepID=A0A5C5FV73_9BASI|nr:ribonucleases P/MRP protein subunit POP5 [Rhodotorula diobovata]